MKKVYCACVFVALEPCYVIGNRSGAVIGGAAGQQ